MRIARLLGAVALAVACGATSGGVAVASHISSDPNYAPLPARIAREISSVTPATLNAIGAGPHGKHANVAPKRSHFSRLKKHGKPELAYIIGEFCPYCAAENWSAAVALSRFGALRGLTTLTTPAGEDRIQTISFRHAHYRSRYFAFDPIVNEDVHRKHVENVPPKIRRTWKKQTYGGGYPFMDFSGRAVLEMPSYDLTILEGMSRAQIAAILNKRHSAVAQSIDGSANQLTAAICVMTDNQPTNICKSKPIAKIRKHLRKLHQ